MIIQLEINDKPGGISYFSLGNFLFEKDGVIFTSKYKKPDQSCMILASLPELFTRLIHLKNGTVRKFEFTPLDSSYSLLFEKAKDKLIITEFSREKLVCGLYEFASGLLLETENLLAENKLEIEELDGAASDFVESVRLFKEAFLF